MDGEELFELVDSFDGALIGDTLAQIASDISDIRLLLYLLITLSVSGLVIYFIIKPVYEFFR